MLNDFDQAIFAYTSAIKLNPESAECHFNLASAYNDKGDTNNALLHYQTSLKYDPHNAETLINVGTLLEAKQSHSQACDAFREALRYAPDNIKAKEGMERNDTITTSLKSLMQK
jgi:tetratricopeptide (TPR) repeat protein